MSGSFHLPNLVGQPDGNDRYYIEAIDRFSSMGVTLTVTEVQRVRAALTSWLAHRDQAPPAAQVPLPAMPEDIDILRNGTTVYTDAGDEVTIVSNDNAAVDGTYLVQDHAGQYHIFADEHLFLSNPILAEDDELDQEWLDNLDIFFADPDRTAEVIDELFGEDTDAWADGNPNPLRVGQRVIRNGSRHVHYLSNPDTDVETLYPAYLPAPKGLTGEVLATYDDGDVTVHWDGLAYHYSTLCHSSALVAFEPLTALPDHGDLIVLVSTGDMEGAEDLLGEVGYAITDTDREFSITRPGVATATGFCLGPDCQGSLDFRLFGRVLGL